MSGSKTSNLNFSNIKTLTTIKLPNIQPNQMYYDHEVKTITCTPEHYLALQNRGNITDEKFIECLGKIKAYCKSIALENCKECKFFVNRYSDEWGRECGHCQFSFIAAQMMNDPADWDLKKLESIIKL